MPSAWLELAAHVPAVKPSHVHVLAAQVPAVMRTHTESQSRANRPAVGPGPCAGDSGSGRPDAIGQAVCPGADGPARCWRLWFWRPPSQVRVWDRQAVENPPFVRVFSLLKTISGRLPMGPLDYGQFPRFLLVQKASTAVVVVWWQVTAALVEGNVLSVFGNLLVASYSSRRAKVSLHL